MALTCYSSTSLRIQINTNMGVAQRSPTPIEKKFDSKDKEKKQMRKGRCHDDAITVLILWNEGHAMRVHFLGARACHYELSWIQHRVE